MDQIVSPDIPAYWCYFIVLSFGMLVAASSINQLLKDTPGRWAFRETWLLFAANASVPVLLFWFLDYTGALRDTSLFAALVVAFGYQQIFSGGVKGILMPGQSSRLWQPFEAWVNRVAARIAASNRVRSERYHDQVRQLVAQQANLLKALERVVYFHTKNATQLTKDLAALDTLPVPASGDSAQTAGLKNDRLARRLLEELRSAEPANYGHYLYRNRIIKWHDQAFRLGKAWSKVFSVTFIVLTATGLVIAVTTFVRSPDWQRRYHQWRMLKTSASAQDHFRSCEFLNDLVQRAATKADCAAEFARIYQPLLRPLRFPAVSLAQVDEIQNFVFHSRAGTADCQIVPELIFALANQNFDVRIRVHRMLCAIQKSSYPQRPCPDGTPTKEDGPSVIAEHVREWTKWERDTLRVL